MFTGIVEELGKVLSVRKDSTSMRLVFSASLVLDGLRIGDSISVDGVCQTVTAFNDSSFTVDTLGETLKKTTFGTFSPGRAVNLERSLTLQTRLGGHFVQGHVNGVGTISHIVRLSNNIYVTVELPFELMKYCVREGSIAIDGISLTVAEIIDTRIKVNIIPHSWKETTFQFRRIGDRVNVETDLLGRYVERFLACSASSGITEEKLLTLGY